MVVGIGVDIVEIERIKRSLEESSTLEKRVFTEREIEYCSKRRARYEHYAGRFAAKEAALKALGTGWQDGIRWKDVETLCGPRGEPCLEFHGKALEVMKELGVTRAMVTITHSRQNAVSVVVLEK